jgi:LPXTG-site transpeptidase (sortase) family protein
VAGIRSIAAVAVVGAVAMGMAACTTAHGGHGTVSSGVSAPSSRPTSVTLSGPPSAAATQPAAGPTRRPVESAQQPDSTTTHEPATAGAFKLVVALRSGTITANVRSISVASREPVDPPHDTAEQWNTAVWVQQSTYPSTPGRGTTYVYGHACHYHVCPFTNLKDARAGDSVRVTTTTRTSTYTIDRVGLSPKSASSLPPWASDSTEPDRLVLVTCAYEHGDTSTNNIVVLARLNQ